MAEPETFQTIDTNMHGVVVAATETGYVADMTHPVQVPGVELPLDALCLTRSYPNPDARTRITQLHVPDLEVRVGDLVTAQVSETSRVVGEKHIPAKDWWERDRWVVDVESLGSRATRWGLRPQK